MCVFTAWFLLQNISNCVVRDIVTAQSPKFLCYCFNGMAWCMLFFVSPKEIYGQCLHLNHSKRDSETNIWELLYIFTISILPIPSFLMTWHRHQPRQAHGNFEKTNHKQGLRGHIGPIWGRQDPVGPHVGSMNFAIWASSLHTPLPIS